MSVPFPPLHLHLSESANDAWGPSSSSIPSQLADLPFAPYSKNDKIGRVADWTQAAYQSKGFPAGARGQAPGPAVFNFFADGDEEASFHLVDNRPVKTAKPYGQRRFGGQGRTGGFQQQGREGRRDGQQGPGGKFQSRDAQGGAWDGTFGDRRAPAMKSGQAGQAQGGQKGRQQWQQNYGPGGRDQRSTNYASSIEIKPEWSVIEQIPFASLAKLTCSMGEPEDVAKCGELEHYDKAYDRITVKSEMPLEKTRRVFRSATTSEDPVIKRLADQGVARVFATDSILTTLMCIRSAIYGWDIPVTKKDGKLFFDRRAQDLLTVNETAPEPNENDKDALNGIAALSLEATAINQNFSQQVLTKTGEKLKFDEPNPFSEGFSASDGLDGEQLSSSAYRYRQWRLNDEEEIDIVVRCEVDGVIQVKGEDQLILIKALNETDLRTQDWRKKIESQRGAVLAFETKNNKNKVAKWTAAALLAGADMLKLGYVSRSGPKDNSNHLILGTQACKPKEFASQITLNMDHCWGIVRALVDMLMKLEDGKFLLLKDANKDLLRIYQL